MKRTAKIILATILIVAMTVPFVSCNSSSENEVRVYNWGDYIDPQAIKMFEEETGYKVTYVSYDTNEAMYNKLKNGNSSYDVIVPSDYMIERLINEDMLEKINFENVPNFKEINEECKHLTYDPNDEYSVAYMWGTLGILYNAEKVTETVDSWEMLWNENYKGKIIMYDSSRDSIGITLAMLGYDINSTNPDELAQAKQKLLDQTDLVCGYGVDDIKDMMIAEEGYIALAWAGDAVYCMAQADNLEYVIPKEGSNIFYDSMCIPKNCSNKEGAEAFINFMCRPDISAMNAAYIGYSTPSDAARKLMGEDGKNPAAYPDVTAYKLTIFKDLGADTKLYDQLWTEVMNAVD